VVSISSETPKISLPSRRPRGEPRAGSGTAGVAQLVETTGPVDGNGSVGGKADAEKNYRTGVFGCVPAYRGCVVESVWMCFCLWRAGVGVKGV